MTLPKDVWECADQDSEVIFDRLSHPVIKSVLVQVTRPFSSLLLYTLIGIHLVKLLGSRLLFHRSCFSISRFTNGRLFLNTSKVEITQPRQNVVMIRRSLRSRCIVMRVNRGIEKVDCLRLCPCKRMLRLGRFVCCRWLLTEKRLATSEGVSVPAAFIHSRIVATRHVSLFRSVVSKKIRVIESLDIGVFDTRVDFSIRILLRLWLLLCLRCRLRCLEGVIKRCGCGLVHLDVIVVLLAEQVV